MQRFAQRFALRKYVEKHLYGGSPTHPKDDLSDENEIMSHLICVFISTPPQIADVGVSKFVNTTIS